MKIFEENGWFGLTNDDDVVVLPTNFYKSFVEEIKDFSCQELLKIKLISIRHKLQPNGMYVFKNGNNKWGLKNYNGKIVSGCEYDFINDYQKGGVARVIDNNKFGLINERGELITEPIYDWIMSYQPDEFIIVMLNNKYGLLDKSGRLVVGCMHENTSLLDDLAYFLSKDNRKL